MSEYKGKLTAPENARVAIVIGRFNELIGKQLLEGAMDGFDRCGLSKAQVDIVWVPGAFEIPVAAKRLAESGRYEAILCLGAVIRGATAHFDYVAGNAASGIASASMNTGIPILFEVLTTDSIEQALERAGTKAGNKGFDGALAAIEMMDLFRSLPASKPEGNPSYS